MVDGNLVDLVVAKSCGCFYFKKTFRLGVNEMQDHLFRIRRIKIGIFFLLVRRMTLFFIGKCQCRETKTKEHTHVHCSEGSALGARRSSNQVLKIGDLVSGLKF